MKKCYIIICVVNGHKLRVKYHLKPSMRCLDCLRDECFYCAMHLIISLDYLLITRNIYLFSLFSTSQLVEDSKKNCDFCGKNYLK